MWVEFMPGNGTGDTECTFIVAMKHMALNFSKLDKFEGVNFRRCQNKMHFLLSNMSVVYVITTTIPEDAENATMEQIRKRNK
uniref:Zinc finger, CCHC-type n=1 Tax=Tanacetum cinerariifolium TaxID=118510 RepID=A0A699JJI5_TANCI|nr:zinc finger, CCHC-type [Tanacetum cinerariifolium]